ncbi:MAG: GNAT family N-acetyltransferase [Candidatus Azobacteroides sp.]|nr:GNAT family N-acetyltransferase [Candidatus Azobacteroides sp.]
MEYHQLSSSQQDPVLLKSIRSIYEQAFPPDERREFCEVLRIAEQEQAFHVDIYTQNGETIGFITHWNFEDFIYVEHFAVDEKTRGKGYGKVILENLLTQSSLPLILEVEPPEDEICKRRIRFYENIGFVLFSAPYLQPPYSPGKNPVSLLLMSFGLINMEVSFNKIVRILHQKVYNYQG